MQSFAGLRSDEAGVTNTQIEAGVLQTQAWPDKYQVPSGCYLDWAPQLVSHERHSVYK